jgi:hypothetical protein
MESVDAPANKLRLHERALMLVVALFGLLLAASYFARVFR